MACGNVLSARQALRLGDGCEPVADFSNSALWFPSVRVDILPGNIRNECMVAVGISVKNQACFLALSSAAKAFTPEIQPKIEIVYAIVQCRDFHLTAVAGAGVYFADGEGAPSAL